MTYTTRVTASTTRRDGIASFVSGIRGAVLRPEDPGYNEARSVWNGIIDRRLMLRCIESASGGLC
jgi:hypothetical protein